MIKLPPTMNTRERFNKSNTPNEMNLMEVLAEEATAPEQKLIRIKRGTCILTGIPNGEKG